MRFWLQSVSRLTSAVWEDAACQALQPLLAVTSDVFAVVVQQRCVAGAGQSICKQGPAHLWPNRKNQCCALVHAELGMLTSCAVLLCMACCSWSLPQQQAGV